MALSPPSSRLRGLIDSVRSLSLESCSVRATEKDSTASTPSIPLPSPGMSPILYSRSTFSVTPSADKYPPNSSSVTAAAPSALPRDVDSPRDSDTELEHTNGAFCEKTVPPPPAHVAGPVTVTLVCLIGPNALSVDEASFVLMLPPSRTVKVCDMQARLCREVNRIISSRPLALPSSVRAHITGEDASYRLKRRAVAPRDLLLYGAHAPHGPHCMSDPEEALVDVNEIFVFFLRDAPCTERATSSKLQLA